MRCGFGEGDLERLPGVLHLAEDLTGEYFKIPAFDAARYPFEVATLKDLDALEIAPRALAHLARYDVTTRHRPRPLYRICLQDDNVLRTLDRDALAFDSLLLYILTHELCHVIRFCDYRQLFDADDARRDSEEALVHELTADILRPLRDPHIRRLAERYVSR
jgi:hypothetical protein